MSQNTMNFMGPRLRVAIGASLALVLLVASDWAQDRPQAQPQDRTPERPQDRPNVSLETSETLFTVLTAINTCGYDQELSISDPLRAQIRSEVAKAVENAKAAQDVIAPMCLFYR